MEGHPVNGGYSARVRLRLECGGWVVPLAQVAPDWIIPSEGRELPPSYGEVVVDVDGREQRRWVYLPDGMRGGVERVAVEGRVAVA